MNYFIDFEATQYSNRIISVGLIREDGKAFYSLVNPHKKITPFIAKLTGITQEDVDNAPSADEVFSKLYDFCTEDSEMPVFYCYGSGDMTFAKGTFHKMVTSFKAGAMLGFLHTGLVDFVPIVKSHFGLCNNIGLAKVADYYRGECLEQNHNALDDAILLKYVFEQIEEHENEFEAFPEYRVQKAANETIKKEKAKVVDFKIFRMKDGRIAETYNTLADAIQWVYDYKIPTNQKTVTNLENVGKKIKQSSRTGKAYCKIKWIVTPIMEEK